MSKSPNLFNFLISFKALRLLFQRKEPLFSTYLHRQLLVLATVIRNHRRQCSFLVIPIPLSFSLPLVYSQLSFSFLSVYSQLSLSFSFVYNQHIRFCLLSVFQLLPSTYGSPLFPIGSSSYLDLLIFFLFFDCCRPAFPFFLPASSLVVAPILLCTGLFFFH